MYKTVRGNGHVGKSECTDVDSRCNYIIMTEHRAYLGYDGDTVVNTSVSTLPETIHYMYLMRLSSWPEMTALHREHG